MLNPSTIYRLSTLGDHPTNPLHNARLPSQTGVRRGGEIPILFVEARAGGKLRQVPFVLRPRKRRGGRGAVSEFAEE